MEAMVTKYGGVADRLAGPITRAPALRLKGLAEEAYQPERYATGLSYLLPSPGQAAMAAAATLLNSA
jgi:hypothetical protein